MGTNLVIVGLDGGDVGDSRAAVCVDMDRGNAGERWAALVRPDRVAELVATTGASIVWGPEAWTGEPFGDGNGGTVEWIDGTVVGNGLNAPALT